MYTTSIPLIQYQLSRNISSRVWLPSPFSTFLHISWTVLPRLSDRVGAKHARLQNKLNQLAQGRQTAITLPQSLTSRGCVGQHVVLQNHSSTYSNAACSAFLPVHDHSPADVTSVSQHRLWHCSPTKASCYAKNKDNGGSFSSLHRLLRA
jgi:hypothetical protein